MEDLRAFMDALVVQHGLRAVGDMIGRGHEQVRKFVKRETQDPQERTRKAMAELYLDYHGARGGVAERPVERLTPRELRSVLSPGLTAAQGEVRRIFELARRHPDEVPATASALERLLLAQLREEYAESASLYAAQPRRRGRKPKGAS